MNTGLSRGYSLAEVGVYLNGIVISEYIDGDAIEIDLDGEDFVETQGTHGAVVRSDKPNFLGTCTLRIMQGSPANDILTIYRKLRKVFTFMVKDNLGRSMCVAPRAWIRRAPPMGFGTEAGSVEWVIRLAHPDFTHGQNFPLIV